MYEGYKGAGGSGFPVHPPAYLICYKYTKNLFRSCLCRNYSPVWTPKEVKGNGGSLLEVPPHRKDNKSRKIFYRYLSTIFPFF